MKLSYGWWVPDFDEWFNKERGAEWVEVAAKLMYEMGAQNLEMHTAVCAGANVGVLASAFAINFTSVLAFEPDKENFTCLQRNCQGRPQVRAIEAALTSRRGSVQLLSTPRACGAARVVMQSMGNVDTVRLDDIHLMTLDLLQINVNGCELETLEGARSTISQHRPLIAVAVNHNARNFGHREMDVDQWFADHGYYTRKHIVRDVYAYQHKDTRNGSP